MATRLFVVPGAQGLAHCVIVRCDEVDRAAAGAGGGGARYLDFLDDFATKELDALIARDVDKAVSQ